MLCSCSRVFLTHERRYDYSERQFAFSWGDLAVWIASNELDLVASLSAAAVVRLDRSQV